MDKMDKMASMMANMDIEALEEAFIENIHLNLFSLYIIDELTF